MRQSMRLCCGIALLLLLAAMGCLSSSGVQAQSPPAAKALLRTGDKAGYSALLARGARLIEDYGSFSLWAIEGTTEAALQSGEAIELHPEYNQLLLREVTLDTSVPSLEGQSASRSGPQLHLVQFVGPVARDWIDDLESSGAQIVAYVPHNGYLIWGDETVRAEIARRVDKGGIYQWHGPYLAEYRLARSLSAQGKAHTDVDALADVVVQVVDHAGSEATIDALLGQAESNLRAPSSLLGLTNLTLRLRAGVLQSVAAREDVVNVEPWQAPELHDERQGQIMAGHLVISGTAMIPSGTGYLTWLDGLGFTTDPAAYPIVDVIDDGFDNGSASNPGHADYRFLGSFAYPSRIAYARDVTGGGNSRGLGSHGTLNVAIVGGYNDIQGVSLYEDGDGYQYGLGISPYGRMASTKVFDDYGQWAYYGTLPDLIAGSYNRGARISNNSWGAPNDNYTADSQVFDALTRDAVPGTAGNQEMIHVFSVGNSQGTLSSPATAKNVIAVGASESYRIEGVSNCHGDGEANDIRDIAAFSSYGPAPDGRVKPELVAPGTRIQGAVSQDPAYATWPAQYLGVCDRYWPTGQTLYTWSSGTSHSAPAVAGALSLIRAYFTEGMLGSGQPAPSPAMLKAYLLNSTRYLDDLETGGNLPAQKQGWGLPDLGRAFDGVPRLLIDQSELLTGAGQEYTLSGVISDPSKPFRVTLAWTDAPGSPFAAAALVNDLDLEVTVGGQTYRGNNFSGETSTTGGGFDGANNVEGVFLPAGTTGPYSVRVIAYTVPGNGVPGNLESFDQDFALVVYNAVPEQDFSLSVSPSLGQVCDSGTLTYTVSVEAVNGYSSTIALSHNAPPPDGTVALVPDSGTPPFEATLWVTAATTTPLDRYTLTITGTGPGLLRHVATTTMDVDGLAPVGSVSLINPSAGITGVPLLPLYSWSPVSDVLIYRLQVAGNEAFSSYVLDTPVDGTAYAAEDPLFKNSTYHWRVVAGNSCGSITSTARVFTTVNPLNVFYDPVESGVGSWSSQVVSGTAQWAITERDYHSPTHAWFVASVPIISDARLTSAPVTLREGGKLYFWHWYDLESDGFTAFDGGVLEVSVAGGPWQDLGGKILRGEYDHVVPLPYENPLGGREAWSGESDGWREVEVDLSDYDGSSIQIRFRYGGDWSVAADGWYVDDVRFTEDWPPFEHKSHLPLIFRDH